MCTFAIIHETHFQYLSVENGSIWGSSNNPASIELILVLWDFLCCHDH